MADGGETGDVRDRCQRQSETCPRLGDVPGGAASGGMCEVTGMHNRTGGRDRSLSRRRRDE